MPGRIVDKIAVFGNGGAFLKEKFGNRQLSFNLIINIVAFIVQFAISFYISPLVVSKVGSTAYGFISLANDFVSYTSIITSVFNSVASRFIAKEYYVKNYEKANRYFNSLIVANIVIACILGFFSILFVPNINLFVSVPDDLLLDVKITFAIVFLSYIVQLITMVFTTSTFVTNRTDIQGGRNIINNIVRLACIIVFLNFVSIKIYWVALASMIGVTVAAILNVRLTKVLTPELTINLKKYASKSYAIILAKSGIWMAFTSISNVLMRGLDLIIANNFISAEAMGSLSIARTMPNQISSIISTLAPLFTPIFLAAFTANRIKDTVQEVNKSINTMACIMFVPICGFIVFSNDFYTLWQSSLSSDAIRLITALSTITVIQAFFNSITAPMAQISVVVNKLKLPVLVSFGCGVLNVVVVMLLLQFTDLGVYAIVLSSTVIMVLRYFIFNSFYAAYCLNQKKTKFIGKTIKCWCSIPILMLIMIFVRNLLPVDSWITLAVDAAICAVIGYLAMFAVYGRDLLVKIVKKIRK